MRITINGRKYYREKRDISYDDIVKHVYGKVSEALITITYFWRGAGDTQRNGTVKPGESIEIADGMRFSACHTGNA